ncbi:ABC transporter substrate-binding protein, partial [Pseudomonas aeruginosa]|nr:ABC transporter substrate-binding protein [Pseudomonas aeruginosa]
MTQLNPFIRGYESFRIERNLQITDEGDNLPCYRALHETQQHLPDEYFQCELCYFNGDFAVVTQDLDEAVAEAECNTVTGLKQVHHAATPLPL